MKPFFLVSLWAVVCACSPIELVDLGGDAGHATDGAVITVTTGTNGASPGPAAGATGPILFPDASIAAPVGDDGSAGIYPVSDGLYPFADAGILACENSSDAGSVGDGSPYSIALPGDNSPALHADWIFFDSDVGEPGLSSIYAIRADGTDLTLLVSPGTQPALSPDGTMLAYTTPSSSNGTTQVFLRRLPGTPQTQISSMAGGADQPAFSPDGKTIAFHAGNNVYVANLDGSGVRSVIVGDYVGVNFEHPVFGPEGKTLIVDTTGEIDVFDLSGHFEGYAVSGVTSDETYPALSPDGVDLAFVAGGCATARERLAVVRFGATSSSSCAGCPLTADDLGALTHPSWGPDGMIAFAHASANGLTRIVVAQAFDLSQLPTEILQDNGNQRNPFWAPTTPAGF